METVQVLLAAVGLYAALGVVFAALFATTGVARIDPAAGGAPMVFRLLIAPGAAAFWPWLLRSWVRAGRDGGPAPEINPETSASTTRHRRWHRLLWPMWGSLALIGLTVATLSRPDRPSSRVEPANSNAQSERGTK